MAPITDGPMSDDLEGSKDAASSVLALGIFVACLIVLLLTIGFGIFGSETMAPNTPQPTTKSPAPSSSTIHNPSRKASASVGVPINSARHRACFCLFLVSTAKWTQTLAIAANVSRAVASGNV